jgi:hypothetical protein
MAMSMKNKTYRLQRNTSRRELFSIYRVYLVSSFGLFAARLLSPLYTGRDGEAIPDFNL